MYRKAVVRVASLAEIWDNSIGLWSAPLKWK